jgi:hypothetical protein
MNWIRHGNIFNRHHAQVPVVDVNENYWRIYYSKRVDGKSQPFYIDVEPENPSRIITESIYPIVPLGNIGSFDWAGIMPTELINVNGQKYLYYIGWSNRTDVPYHNTLGLAISDNGERWKKISTGPIFGTSYKEPGYIGTISVFEKDKLYYGYYLSCREWITVRERVEPIYDIKIAISENAVDWEPTNRVAVALESGEGGISKACVLELEDGYYMWYSVRMSSHYRESPERSYRIKCSYSRDLIDWQRIDDFGLDIDPTSDWENIMVEYPHVFEFNNKLHMFYNGNGFGKTGIGYATLTR